MLKNMYSAKVIWYSISNCCKGTKGLVREGTTTLEGVGVSEVTPLQKRESAAGKALAMLKGGQKQFLVLAILKEAQIVSTLLKVGAQNVLPCLQQGDAKSFGPMIFPFCSPYLP